MARFVDRLFRHVRKRYRSAAQPRRGADVLVDLTAVIKPRLIFDVGANVGQSAARFTRRFPPARVHCFEPSVASAERIRARRLRNVEVHQIALGSAAGEARLSHGNNAAISRIADDGDEPIGIDTIDAFCSERGVRRIDFVKIDTEGHDLEVLKGAAGMLAAGQIAAVQVEAGLNPENTLHIPFETLKAYLEGYGYRLFGIYDQVNEWPTKQPHLRRANPVFVSAEVYGRGR